MKNGEEAVMTISIGTKRAGMVVGFFAMMGLSMGISQAHPGGAPPPVHPVGAANMGMVHMSPAAANFGTGVAAVADTQGKTI